MFLELLPRLNPEKYEVTVLCVRKWGELKGQFIKKGFKVNLIVIKRVHLLRNFLKLVRFIKEGRFDIVHSNMYDANTPARVAAKLAGIPVIIAHEHNIENWKRKKEKMVDRLLANFTDKVVAVSQGVKNFLIEEEGIPESKIEVIYNGIDIKRFENVKVSMREKKKEFGIASQEKVVGIVSRIAPQKGHKYFIQVATKILKSFPDTKFLIVGEGKRDLEGEIKKIVREQGIEKQVIFTGSREDIPEIISIMDVFVFPSLREGFGNVLVEAMACKKPIVAFDIPGVNEVIVNGKTGFLVSPGEVEVLAEKTNLLLKDREIREKMGEFSTQRAKVFSIERMVEKTESLYDELLHEKFYRDKRLRKF